LPDASTEKAGTTLFGVDLPGEESFHEENPPDRRLVAGSRDNVVPAILCPGGSPPWSFLRRVSGALTNLYVKSYNPGRRSRVLSWLL